MSNRKYGSSFGRSYTAQKVRSRPEPSSLANALMSVSNNSHSIHDLPGWAGGTRRSLIEFALVNGMYSNTPLAKVAASSAGSGHVSSDGGDGIVQVFHSCHLQ